MIAIQSPFRFPSPTQPLQPGSSRSRRRAPPRTVIMRIASAKPSICTADELHYVSVPGSDWSLALWRYLPPPNVARRNHPLLLLSGVGTNAIGYDLSPPRASFARHMCGKGFETWTLEVRGAGLSMRGEKSLHGLIDAWRTHNIGNEIQDISQKITNLEGWRTFPPPFFGLHERIPSFVEDFQEHVDLLFNNDWDMDEYLKEDIPAVMEYIRSISKPRDSKLLAVGHSMGGILLYALLSSCGSQRQESGLGAVVTLGSSLDYSSSKSSVKLLLPLAERVRALNFPAVPIGAFLAAIHPLASRHPSILPWLNYQISSKDMIPEFIERLIMKNFCTIPTKLLLQLSTAFQKNGLRNRSRTFTYKNHLQQSNVPIMALAGDQDVVCPPEAVYETAKVVPEHLVTFKVFGELDGPHYAHYDIVGSHMAAKQVYPHIVKFLGDHDSV